MEPVRTSGSNFRYLGPTPDIGDAWVERHRAEHAVYLTWQLTDEERLVIAAGGTLRMGIFGMEPIPPVSLAVSTVQPLSAVGAELRDRALKAMSEAKGPEDTPERPGWWSCSGDVWRALQREHALDPDDGSVPTLWGRPLLVQESAPEATLEFTLPLSTREGRA